MHGGLYCIAGGFRAVHCINKHCHAAGYRRVVRGWRAAHLISTMDRW